MNRPGQMRRHARRMRRYGLQPMIVMNSGGDLPELAIVVILRWAWRYRSELAPLMLTIAAGLAGWALHATHPHAWPYFAVGAVLATAGALLAGRRAGLVTQAERLYAAVALAAAGSWLAAATALGLRQSPLPQLLAVGGLVLAVPWWAHGRRRAKVRVERTLAAWPEIAHAVGLPGSRVMSAVVDLWGWRARLALARGQTISDAIGKVPQIESGLGTFRGAVRITPTPDDLAHRLELRVLSRDPHADAIPWPGPSVTSITQPVDLGPFEDAAPCRVLVLRRHSLFGGTSGSGKSGGVNVLTGNLVACIDVVIWAIDLKRGMELQPWASCLGRLAVTPAQARMLLADAVAVLEARADYLTARGQRVWEPSPDMPALVIIVDEYAELPGDVTGHTDSIARRGRAPAVTLLAATQRPTQKAMGQGTVRSQMDVRICFRVRERKDTDLILGQGMLSAGWQPHTLNAPGKFLISDPEHQTPRRARAYLLTDEDVSATAARYAPGRPVLDAVSAAAIGTRNLPPDDDLTGPPAPSTQMDRRREDPEAILWEALQAAPPAGATVADLMQATAMGRSWVYYRLADLAAAGRAIQVTRGCWRASPSWGAS